VGALGWTGRIMSDWKREHGSLPDGWTPPGSTLELARYAIHCDEPGCNETSPSSDAVNFETGGERMAGALAEQNGWVRVRLNGTPTDLCPLHAPRKK
jgi:hypothetical protein